MVTFIFVFTMLVPLAWGDFKSTDFDFKKIEINTELTATYTYLNIDSGPVILYIPNLKTDLGKCWVSDYTKAPILPTKTGTVTLKCNFKQLGFHSQGIYVSLIEKTGKNQTQLTYRAMAYKKVIKVAPKPSPKPSPAPKNKTEVKPAPPKKIYPPQPDMDLNTSSPLKNMPVGDQDGAGICYAFASATAVEYELRSKGINRTVSPIDVGFVLKSGYQTWAKDLESGSTFMTIGEIRTHGAATKECIDRVIKKETANTNMTSENFLNFMQKIYDLKASKKTEKEIEKAMDGLCKSYGVSTAELEDYVEDFQVPLRTYLRNLFAACEQERNSFKPSDLPQYLYFNPLPHDEMKAKIDYFMNNKSPAIITVCAEILQGQVNHKGLTEKREMKKDANKKDLCGAHAVVITGRKTVDGISSYLVRNSWGASWQGKGLSCACKTPSAYYSDCSQAPKSQGNKVVVGCWVPENKLIPNMMSVGGFK